MSRSFPSDIVSRIKEETDIVSVVRGYVTLAPTGSGFKGLCPFHREKTASFNVNPDRQIYKCFGCGEGGDVLSFLMKIEGISFPEAIETLARPLDIDLASFLRQDEDEGERVAFHRANEAAASIWQDALWNGSEGDRPRGYLQDRGFGEEVLRRFEVGYATGNVTGLIRALDREGVNEPLALRAGILRQRDQRAPFAYFRNRIIFPIKNIAQRIAGFGGRIIDQGEPKYLNSSDSTYFTKGKLLYGFAVSRMAIARLKTAILVEGYLDFLAMVQAGFSNVVATCGTAFTEGQARLLRRGCSTLVTLFDGDRAGLQAGVKCCHTALAVGLEAKVARLPVGEDPASLLYSRDRRALEEVLGGAQDYLHFLMALVEERGGGRQAKERALRQALGSVVQVPDTIRREYLIEEAAQLFDIPREVLRRHVKEEVQQKQKRERRSEESDSRPARPPSRGAVAQRAGGVRSLAAVNRPAIEATLLAHVLRDRTGEAARLLLDEGEDFVLSSPSAETLRRDLQLWWGASADQPALTPAQFVQEHWHEKEGDYRNFISDLLTEEAVPDRTDFARVVRDCLVRLNSARAGSRASDDPRGEPQDASIAKGESRQHE